MRTYIAYVRNSTSKKKIKHWKPPDAHGEGTSERTAALMNKSRRGASGTGGGAFWACDTCEGSEKQATQELQNHVPHLTQLLILHMNL